MENDIKSIVLALLSFVLKNFKHSRRFIFYPIRFQLIVLLTNQFALIYVACFRVHNGVFFKTNFYLATVSVENKMLIKKACTYKKYLKNQDKQTFYHWILFSFLLFFNSAVSHFVTFLLSNFGAVQIKT